jgi:hypothetical protein
MTFARDYHGVYYKTFIIVHYDLPLKMIINVLHIFVLSIVSNFLIDIAYDFQKTFWHLAAKHLEVKNLWCL